VGGGNDVSFSLMELTQYCQEITGNKIAIHPVSENRVADIRIYTSDCSKIHAINGWKPQKNIETLLLDTFEWMKANEQQLKQILS
jgi:CDP-paratose 2-epimerase